MSSSRDRARRDYQAAQQHPMRADSRFDSRASPRSDSRSDNRFESRSDSRDARADARRPFKRDSPIRPTVDHNRKRFRSNGSQGPAAGSNGIAHGAVGSSLSPRNSELLASIPRLAHKLASRRAAKDWPWDKHAEGYENVSAQALKLLGYATPESDYGSAAVPPEVVKIRNTKPLKPSASWIVCQVGETVYPTPRKAAEALAQGAGKRPLEARRVLLNDPEDGLFTDHSAIIVRNVTSQDEVEQRYGEKATQCEHIGTETFVAKFKGVSTTKENDVWLFPSDTSARPVIEVLNAFSLADPRSEDVLSAVASICAQLGFDKPEVWRSEDSLPYNVPRVFVALPEQERVREAAIALGRMTLQGRPLITSLNYSAKLKASAS